MASNRILVAVLFTAFLALVAPSAATAHSELLESNPVADSTVAELPAAVILTFNQDIQPEFSTVTLTDSNGTNWIPDAPTVDGPRVRATIDATAPASVYTVGYRVLSADGHPISGSFAFTFTPDRTPGVVQSGAAVAAESTQVGDDAAQSGTSNRAFTWLFGAAAAGLAVAGVFVLFRGKRGSGSGRTR